MVRQEFRLDDKWTIRDKPTADGRTDILTDNNEINKHLVTMNNILKNGNYVQTTVYQFMLVEFLRLG